MRGGVQECFTVPASAVHLRQGCGRHREGAGPSVALRRTVVHG